MLCLGLFAQLQAKFLSTLPEILMPLMFLLFERLTDVLHFISLLTYNCIPTYRSIWILRPTNNKSYCTVATQISRSIVASAQRWITKAFSKVEQIEVPETTYTWQPASHRQPEKDAQINTTVELKTRPSSVEEEEDEIQSSNRPGSEGTTHYQEGDGDPYDWTSPPRIEALTNR